jgi:thiol-disulfide isomerase/thioredoxin
MKKAIALTSLGIIAIAAIIVTVSWGSGSVGVKEAAACTDLAPKCYPGIDMVDINGEVFTPDSLKGQVILVNFWATWCKPCKKEIPDLSGVYGKYKDKGLIILGVLDDNVNQEVIEKFIEDTKMNFPVVRYDDEIGKSFSYPGKYPTTFVYGRNGELVERKEGIYTEESLEALLEKHI